MDASINLTRASASDASLLDRIWQFYELESSFWSESDIDDAGKFTSLSGFLSRLGEPDSFDWAYIIRHEGKLAGLLIVGRQNFEGRSIMEFADLYVLPKYRGKGVASEVIRQTMLSSNEPWLICVFREDKQAMAFWRAAFERLAFTSVREVLQPEDHELHEFIVNEAPALIGN